MRFPTLTGIDVLRRDEYRQLRGRSVGLITNHTGLDSTGAATVDLLHDAPEVKLKALFGPEHGIRGAVDAAVPDGRDERTGLPVYSLYGERHSPSEAQMEGIDLLIYDIQDVGARFYTYSSTLGLCLETAARHHVPFVVLDRPDPIGGIEVEGPIADADSLSFVAHHTIPIRHGLTMGEFARLLNFEKSLGADLTVIRAERWKREEMWDATGLMWTNPSPNMRSLTQALIYPGLCLLEYTNISVGRGTDTPFELFGAPWLNARRVSMILNDAELPGARFVPVQFTPASSKFVGQRCEGVNIIVADLDEFKPVLTGMVIIEALMPEHRSDWDPQGVERLLVNRAAFTALMNGQSAEQIVCSWDRDLELYGVRAKPHLLYD